MQEQKKFKYIYNGKEVDRKQFEELAGDNFKWFEGNSIVSVPFSSFDSFFDGEFKSVRKINDHLDSVLDVYKNKVTEDIINKSKCSPQCYCDGSCKKMENNLLNSTRHKVKEEGIFHKDDVITSSNRGEKETLQGLKYNNLKPSLDIVINRQFPKALQLIALATEYGHKKYIENDSNYLNYKSVKGGSQTYFDASARHSTDRNGLDESGLPHIIHAVWSSLAGLELWIEENNINVKEFTENFMKNLHNSK